MSGLRAAPDRLAQFVRASAEGDSLAPTSVAPQMLDRVFVTDASCLSVMATVAQWGGARADRLYSAERLAEWLTLAELPPLRAPATPAQLGLLAELRLAIYALVAAKLDGVAPDPQAITTVNLAAEAKGVTPLLRPDDIDLRDDLTMTFAEFTATVAQSCIEVVAGPWEDRLRRCDRSPCSHVFVDRSARGLRRWCTSTTCGNLARGRRHRDRRAAEQVGAAAE